VLCLKFEKRGKNALETNRIKRTLAGGRVCARCGGNGGARISNESTPKILKTKGRCFKRQDYQYSKLAHAYSADLSFVKMDGEPLQGYKHWFADAVASFRHTGVDLPTVAELMGHRTIQMTMRSSHLAPAHKLAAVERLTGTWHLSEATDTRAEEQTAENVPAPN
jgi:hypothetical protein